MFASGDDYILAGAMFLVLTGIIWLVGKRLERRKKDDE